MDTHARKLLMILTEGALEKALTADVLRLGAQSYSVVDVRAGDTTGERAASWEGDRNIEVKVIATAAVAEAIASHVLATYCANYAVRMFLADVEVLRPEKFS